MSRISYLLIILFSLFHIVNGQQQWPMVGGNAEGNSWAAAENSLYPPFASVESFLPYLMPGDISDFTIFEDILVAGVTKSSGNVFYGINMVTMDTLWVFPVPGSDGAVMFIPAQNSEYVIATAQGSNTLFCLHRETGTVKWARDFYFTPAGHSPVIDDNNVFINTDSLFCLDITDGHTLWFISSSFGQTAPCVDDNTCFLTANQKTIAVNKNTGDLIWSKYNSNFHSGVVAVDDLFLYTLSNDSVIARNKVNGSVEWAYRIPDAIFPDLMTKSLTVDDSVVAVAINENSVGVAQLLAVDKRNGDYLWDHSFTSSGINSPTMANGVLYILKSTESNLFRYYLAAFKQKTGELFYTEESENYLFIQPVVYEHQLFCAGYSQFIRLANPASPVALPERRQGGIEMMVTAPNPVFDMVNLRYTISSAGFYSLQLVDINGRLIIRVFDNRMHSNGIYSENIQIPAGLNSGIYLLRLESEKESHSIRISIQR